MTEIQKELPLSQRGTKESLSRQNSLSANGGSLNSLKDEPRRGSILKGSSNYQLKKREDNYGNEIGQPNKEHKVCFSENLVEVNEVENWKRFNTYDEDLDGRGCCNAF